jgi:tetratricopeptide (TPR) repeat protein
VGRGKAVPDEVPQDSFTTPDDELICIEDVEKMFQCLVSASDSPDHIKEYLMILAQESRRRGYARATCGYLEKALSLTEAPRERAEFLLTIGQMLEGSDDYRAALEAYTRAFELPQERNAVWYFLHNNRAYCLNKESRHVEAETHCRVAITINVERHNAHKNLGVALHGQGRYVEAARSFASANRLCPADGRSLALLKSLLLAHPEVLEEAPDLFIPFCDRGTSEPIGSC